MNRRSFITALAGSLFTAAEIAQDPDKLLWIPKLISLPPVLTAPTEAVVASVQDFIDNSLVRGNGYLTSDMITRKCLEQFANNLRFAAAYDLQFAVADQWPPHARVGNTLTIRRPPRYRSS